MLGADMKNISLVFGDSQMSGSFYKIVKGASLVLHSLRLEVTCVATSSPCNSFRHSQDALLSFSQGGCRSNETWEEIFSELRAHLLFLHNPGISSISGESSKSAVGQSYGACLV